MKNGGGQRAEEERKKEGEEGHEIRVEEGRERGHRGRRWAGDERNGEVGS